MAYRKYFIILILIVFSFLNVVTFVTRVPAEGLSDIFGAIIPPGAAPGDSVGQQVVGSPTPLPGTGTPTGPITPPVGTPTPAPTGTYTPIVVSGLTYYPQCSSPAIPGAYWSDHPMPREGNDCNSTYCGFGCGITSFAMVFSSLSGEQPKDPEQFMGLYTQYGAPGCLVRYPLLRTLLGEHNIDTQTPVGLPIPKSLFSADGAALIDGYLQTGQTVLVYGLVGGDPTHPDRKYNHFVWIVGKENGHYNIMDPYWSAPHNEPGPPFPVVPYTSNRYSSFMIYTMLAVKRRV